MKLLVGSSAIKAWYPEFNREPKDIDYIVTRPEEKIRGDRNVEYFYHPLLAAYFESVLIPFGGCHQFVATPDQLYTLKLSHSFWALRNGSWAKHMYDMCWLRNKGAVKIDELFDIAYKTWEEVHGKKKANLNVPASEFFTKAIKRTYDHDSIHASIAYGQHPLYESILRDGSEVAVSREKFENLSHEDKCRLVREEVYATALERILIPSDYSESPMRAYGWAMCKTITSFSKGWFPLWIVENYEELRKPDCDYVQRHLDNSDKLILLEAS